MKLRWRARPMRLQATPAFHLGWATLQFNSYYHLALSRYLLGDYEGALAAYSSCWEHSQINDESIVATV